MGSRPFPLPLRSLFVSPAKAGAQEPRWCRCHGTDLSAVNPPPARCLGSRSFRFPCALFSFPPRKRGPRNRSGAAATERTSAQRTFRRRGAQALLKKQHPPCCGGCGGLMSFWLPPSAPWPLGPGLRRENDEINRRQIRAPFVSPAKAGAQEPQWCRCHGADLSAVNPPPARCMDAHEKEAPSVLRRLWWFNVLLVATQCPVVPGSRPSPGKR